MEDTNKFIEFVNNVCRRPKMYTLNGTFGEVAAIFTGIEIAAANSPIGADSHRTLNLFVTSRLLVPDKYWWPGAIQMLSTDDAAAICKMRELLVEFTTLRKTESLETIRELAVSKVEAYTETEPARIWRRFLAARHTAEREEIEPLIMPHPDSHVLWCGEAMPSDVAAPLNSISDSYVVSVLAGSIESGYVTLIAEMGKIHAHLVDAFWRVDASPIIEIDQHDAQVKWNWAGEGQKGRESSGARAE